MFISKYTKLYIKKNYTIQWTPIGSNINVNVSFLHSVMQIEYNIYCI